MAFPLIFPFPRRVVPAVMGLLLLTVLLPQGLWAADRALLIGIDAYQRDPRITPLQGTLNDARAMERFLREQAGYRPENIRLLLNEEATRDGIIQSIEQWLIAGTRPGDRVLLHFSGHGAQVPALRPGDLHDQVLVAVDAYVDGRGNLRNFVRDKELGALLDRIPDRKVTVVVDACHSGAITRQIGIPNLDGLVRTPMGLAAHQNLTPRLTRSGSATEALLPSTPNRTVWTAVSSHQLAYEDIETQPRMGFFTRRFIQGIQERRADLNGDGQVSHLELHRWLGRESAGYCRRLGIRCQLGITPTLEIARTLQVVPVEVTLAGQPAPTQDVQAVATAALVVPAQSPSPAISSTTEPMPVVATPPTAPTPPAPQVPPIVEEDLRIDILPNSTPRYGETVRFRVTSPMDGHLLVLNIDPAGQLIQLFPNRFSERQAQSGRIQRGRPITIPDATYGFEFTVQEPLGSGRLLAIVTADPVDLSDLAAPTRGLEVVAVGSEVDHLLKIAERLRQTWTTDALEQRPLHWELAEHPYQTRR